MSETNVEQTKMLLDRFRQFKIDWANSRFDWLPDRG